MFDIGGLELLLIAVVALLVIGPERLPEALRTLGLWLGRLRRSFTSVKAEIEKEIGMDEVRRQLHNEAVMDEMKRIEQEVASTKAAAQDLVKPQEELNIDPNAAMFDEATKDQRQRVPEPDVSSPEPDQDLASSETAGPEEATPAGAASSDAPAEDVAAAATDHSDAAAPEEPAEKRLPPTDADLEAAWERKERARKQT
jgi:sec-independent protein translocase protein TatB